MQHVVDPGNRGHCPIMNCGEDPAAFAKSDVRRDAAWDMRPDVAPGLLWYVGGKFYWIGRKLPVFLRNA